MNELRMQIELCPEDRARLDTIIDGLVQLARGQYRIEAAVETAGTPYKEETPAPVEHAPIEDAPAEPAPSEVYTEADLRHMAVTLAKLGKKQNAADVILSYAESLSKLDPAVYNEVGAKLEELMKVS